MRTRPFTVAVVVCAATGAVAAVPAIAHEVKISHGADYARLWDGHSQLNACDHETDGHRVRTQYRLYGHGDEIFVTPWDPDGPNGALCGWKWLSGDIKEFRLCEEVVGCTVWTPR